MSKNEIKLKGPWKNVQTGIWLIGLGVLFYFNWFWPGILVLIGISMLSQALIQALAPDAVESEEPEEPPIPFEPGPQPPAVAPAEASHPTQRLPADCPKCGAPIRGIEVNWTGPTSADCPYCGANLPLKAA